METSSNLSSSYRKPPLDPHLLCSPSLPPFEVKHNEWTSEENKQLFENALSTEGDHLNLFENMAMKMPEEFKKHNEACVKDNVEMIDEAGKISLSVYGSAHQVSQNKTKKKRKKKKKGCGRKTSSCCNQKRRAAWTTEEYKLFMRGLLFKKRGRHWIKSPIGKYMNLRKHKLIINNIIETTTTTANSSSHKAETIAVEQTDDSADTTPISIVKDVDDEEDLLDWDKFPGLFD
ncbi:hypothetical protein Pint_28749 [Pistacia integerrima]|uniref:Uncharacterized protein n=1 Tax=Pistacia integerrima TaxID=434235 RepID=A0ACC0YMK2_9ROSI|nr:hypothetical protein Pint_28749 [Pistacia integerrima]